MHSPWLGICSLDPARNLNTHYCRANSGFGEETGFCCFNHMRQIAVGTSPEPLGLTKELRTTGLALPKGRGQLLLGRETLLGPNGEPEA